jgi:hypothetical protein
VQVLRLSQSGDALSDPAASREGGFATKVALKRCARLSLCLRMRQSTVANALCRVGALRMDNGTDTHKQNC